MRDHRWFFVSGFLLGVAFMLLVFLFSSQANAQLPTPQCHIRIVLPDVNDADATQLPNEVHWLEVEMRDAFFFFRWHFSEWRPLGVHLGRVTATPATCSDGTVVVKDFAVSFACKCGGEMEKRWRPLLANHEPYVGGLYDGDWQVELLPGDDWVCPEEGV